jgi:hypothetical protein
LRSSRRRTEESDDERRRREHPHGAIVAVRADETAREPMSGRKRPVNGPAATIRCQIPMPVWRGTPHGCNVTQEELPWIDGRS